MKSLDTCLFRVLGGGSSLVIQEALRLHGTMRGLIKPCNHLGSGESFVVVGQRVQLQEACEENAAMMWYFG